MRFWVRIVLRTGLYAVLICSLSLTQAQVTLVVKSVPDSTPPDAQLYLAGSFQGWNAGLEDFRFERMNDGTFRYVFHPEQGSHEYKLTRGSWASGEAGADGQFLPNRTFTYSGQPLTQEIVVEAWDDLVDRADRTTSTASDNVQILDKDFYMPQLDRERRVWIYLPPDYHSSSKSYPVLYMHDGQNVFDAATAYAGEWRVDESLDSLHAAGDHGCIVVAVDNGGDLRMDEYNPWVHPEYGGGEGDEYIEFIVGTLKEHIDVSYRTLSDREHTGILGSSMGGLISSFAGLAYPEVFGQVGAFSPAYWAAEETHDQAMETVPQMPVRIYTVVGALEGEQYVRHAKQMRAELIGSGHAQENLVLKIHEDGNHREWYWAREFPTAYLWLFSDKGQAGK